MTTQYVLMCDRNDGTDAFPMAVFSKRPDAEACVEDCKNLRSNRNVNYCIFPVRYFSDYQSD